MSGLLALSTLLVAPSTAPAEYEIRVELRRNRKSVRVGAKALSVTNAEDETKIVEGDEDREVFIKASDGNLQIRGAETATRKIRRVVVDGKRAVRVDDGVYYGRIEVRADPDKPRRLFIVNRLPLTSYLLGVVGHEMSGGWPREALKAQAVAARTYAMRRRVENRSEPFDLSDDALSQVYRGAERIGPQVIEAVRSTRGEVLGYDHGLADAVYHSTCGGGTRSSKAAFGGSAPYLVEQTCEWCRGSPTYRWVAAFSRNEASELLRRAGLIDGSLRVLERSEDDSKVRVEAQREREVPAAEVRRALGSSKMPSVRFAVKTDGDKVTVAGRGFGHGVGMCQWGARGQALVGRGYREILAYYYPGARIYRLY